jgi:hypothetical protein
MRQRRCKYRERMSRARTVIPPATAWLPSQTVGLIRRLAEGSNVIGPSRSLASSEFASDPNSRRQPSTKPQSDHQAQTSGPCSLADRLDLGFRQWLRAIVFPRTTLTTRRSKSLSRNSAGPCSEVEGFTQRALVGEIGSAAARRFSRRLLRQNNIMAVEEITGDSKDTGLFCSDWLPKRGLSP